ncbi:hypothetical protein DMB37_09945 [Nocardia sp. CS682]|nr:hypothetical protein DMB37_09945 [Nocardia sp. CS682]
MLSLELTDSDRPSSGAHHVAKPCDEAEMRSALTSRSQTRSGQQEHHGKNDADNGEQDDRGGA